MLVLSRKVGEKIQIGDNITLEVRKIAGTRVAIAFDAPKGVRILRGELERYSDQRESAQHAQKDLNCYTFVSTGAEAFS
jgi:carbon storage regulator